MDTRFYERAQDTWVGLLQSYTRLELRLALQIGRYAHAR